MQERDKALQAIKELIKQKKDEIMQAESEINGVRNETRKEQEISNSLHEKLSKAQREFEILQQKKAEIEAEQKHLNE